MACLGFFSWCNGLAHLQRHTHTHLSNGQWADKENCSKFNILHFNLLQSVEGMKVVCHELAQATNDPEGIVMDELVKDADRLVSCLANKVIKITVHLK